MASITKIVTVTAALMLAAAGAWLAFKEGIEVVEAAGKEAEATESEVKLRETSSVRESLKELSTTQEPDPALDMVYQQFLQIREAIQSGKLTESNCEALFLTADWPAQQASDIMLRPEAVLRDLLAVHTDVVGPRLYTGIVGQDDQDLMVLVHDGYVFTLCQRSQEMFMAAGPSFDELSTTGYLELVLETVITEWKL
jgi:hypothetical protein